MGWGLGRLSRRDRDGATAGGGWSWRTRRDAPRPEYLWVRRCDRGKRSIADSPRRASKLKAMVLAAGVGTRLRPVTDGVPKPMVSLGGRPLLAYNVDWLRRYGVCDLVINLHYLPEVIRSYFGDGSELGVNIRYSYEPELLGTSG